MNDQQERKRKQREYDQKRYNADPEKFRSRSRVNQVKFKEKILRRQKNYIRSLDGRFKQAAAGARWRFRGKKTPEEAWNLTKEMYVVLISNPCYYCECPIGEVGVGLDRLDNSKGYISGNVVPCCKECNTARNDLFTPVEMEVIGEAVRRVKVAREVDEELRLIEGIDHTFNEVLKKAGYL